MTFLFGSGHNQNGLVGSAISHGRTCQIQENLNILLPHIPSHSYLRLKMFLRASQQASIPSDEFKGRRVVCAQETIDQ